MSDPQYEAKRARTQQALRSIMTDAPALRDELSLDDLMVYEASLVEAAELINRVRFALL